MRGLGDEGFRVEGFRVEGLTLQRFVGMLWN